MKAGTPPSNDRMAAPSEHFSHDDDHDDEEMHSSASAAARLTLSINAGASNNASPVGTPSPTAGGDGLLSFAQLHGPLVCAVRPMPELCFGDVAFTTEGPYDRVLVPPLLTSAADTHALAPVLYGRIADGGTDGDDGGGSLVALLKLHSGPELVPDLLADFECQLLRPGESTTIAPLATGTDSDTNEVVEVLGRVQHRGAHYILFAWVESGILHRYLRQFGPAQAHRIARVRRTQQMMHDLKHLHALRVSREAYAAAAVELSAGEATAAVVPPALSSTAPLDILDIPEADLHYERDHLGARRVLGHGAYATVYLGRWAGTLVAIKQLHHRLSVETVHEIEREVRLMRASQSPHIVRVEGTCRKDGEYVIVMEYMSGGDLFHYIQEHDQIPWPQRLSWMCELADGLRLLHARRIAHGDQKTLNFLLDANLHLKLCDFGLSKYGPDSSTKVDGSARAGGTPRWQCPSTFAHADRGFLDRLFRRKRHGDDVTFLAADVWSFGFSLVEIMTGKLPFYRVQQEADVIQILRTITPATLRAHLPSFPSSCPVDLCDLIHSCLSLDPASRPPMSHVAETLHRIDPLSYESLAHWRECQSTMSSMLQSVAAFNRVRVMVGFYSLFMSDEETRDFEADWQCMREIDTFVSEQNQRPAAEQPTQPDQMERITLPDLDPLAPSRSRSHSRSPPPPHHHRTPEQKDDEKTRHSPPTSTNAVPVAVAASLTSTDFAPPQPPHAPLPVRARPHLPVLGRWHSSQLPPDDLHAYEELLRAHAPTKKAHRTHYEPASEHDDNDVASQGGAILVGS